MQTLKTAVVVLLLLVVFYGVYEMLNRPPDAPPKEVAAMDDMSFAPPDINFGNATGDKTLEPMVSVPATEPAASPVSPVPNLTAPDLASTEPVPPDTANGGTPGPPPPSVYPTLSRSTDRQSPGASGDGLGSNMPSSLGAPSAIAESSPRKPASDLQVSDPGAAQMQHNPYLTQNVATRPASNAAEARQKSLGAQGFQAAWKRAQQDIKSGQYREALSSLSRFYKSQDLTAQQQQELLGVLDPLAAKVIYSKEHLIEPPYRVRGSETLDEVARQYNVPPQLLQKINAIQNPNVLLPGSELKIVPGPFRAEVDLAAQELTLFLDGLYAGRFPITVGNDPTPLAGDFQVRDKQQNRAFFGANGITIPAGSPTNPFGNVWLDLGREVCIHGSAAAGREQGRGCISLSPHDADDVFSILSVGSNVRILR